MAPDQQTTIQAPQDALLVTQGLNPCGCIVSSVDFQGQQISFSVRDVTSPAVLQQLSVNGPQTADLHLFASKHSGNLHVQVRGQVSPGKDRQFVLTANFSDQLATELNALKGVSESFSVLADTQSLDALKRLYQQHSLRLLERLLPAFIEEARRGIEQDLEDAAEVREINRLKDMRYIFDSRQSHICRDFETRFSTNNAVFITDGTNPRETGELKVVNLHVFEDWLDLQSVASRLEVDHADRIFALNQLLNQIFWRDIADSNNPLSPSALCTCLQYATDRLAIAPEHRTPIYRAFRITLQQVWAPAMQSLIQDCARAGLRALEYSQLPPNWSRRDDPATKTDGPTVTSPAAAPSNSANTAKEADDYAPLHTADLSVFRLMGLEHNGATDVEGWQRSSAEFCAHLKPQRSNLLEKLQVAQPEISRALRELATEDPDFGNTVDQPTLQKAALVDQLFAPLQGHEGMSQAVRAKLEQLRLPVFELLLDTPEFLNDEDHPAREIVNDLMRLGFAERASTKSLEATVSGIIEELIHIQGPDASKLQQLSKKLKKLVERQEQSFLRNSDRLAKTLEGKERLKNTRRQVQQKLNTMLAGQQTPTVLLDLLEAGWEQLMILALLREGPKSHHFGELLEVVGLLQTWLVPESQNEELAFERELESGPILQSIDRELRNVGDIARVRSVMAELTDQLQYPESIPTVHLERYGDLPDADATRHTPAQDRWTGRARELSAGDWVEIRLEGDESRKLRLVWGGEDVLRFVFLSPRGMSEVSFEFPEFVHKLRTGEATIVEEGEIPFVDQSLFNIVQDIYRRLNFQATHDALTGCMYRHDFEKLISALQSKRANAEGAAALVVLDIDEFSVINASYGADAGDNLLQATGKLIQQQCRSQKPERYAARIGGNEFAILMEGSALEESLDFAENLRRDFESQVFTSGRTEYRATLTASVCPIYQANVSAGDLLNDASLSLKSAKQRGGNRVELLQGSGTPSERETPRWVSEIDRRIQDGSLYLRAQPIVPLGSKAQGGRSFEVLLGLTDASGKQVSPQGFIQAAEQFRRSTRVDLWVVQEILGWMKANPTILAGIDTLNVNLSGASLSDDRFMLDLEALLKRNRDYTAKICFEVTETSAVANLHYAADFMRELKQLDCRFALDDFGTGLSSFAYLQKLPVDYVKIDGIFVRDLATNLTNYAMVRSINELCHFLDLKTIAECVEDKDILETIQEIQIDFAQGFGIAKPARLDSLTRESRTSTGLCL